MSLIGNFEFLINFVLNWKSVTIPTESSGNIMSSLDGISANNILDCSCGNMSIMRSTSGKWWAIVESIWWKIFCKLQLLFKTFILFPIVENNLLFIGERKSFRSYKINIELLGLNSVLLSIYLIYILVKNILLISLIYLAKNISFTIFFSIY